MVEWITTTGKEWYSDMSEYLEDNLSDYPIPSPTNEGIVCKFVEGKKNEKVILYRGTSYEQANNMEQFCSAGGKQLPNTNAQPPSSEAAKRQVGFGRALPEFTAKYDSSWSFDSCLVVVAINTRYLTRGSWAEQGWLADESAPIEIKAKVDRRVNEKSPTGLRRANAS